MPWFIYLALKQLFPKEKKYVSVFFLLSALGVSLGVAVLLIVQGVMGGFGEVHRSRIVDTSGHMEVSAYGYPITGYEDKAQLIRENIPVERVMPFAQGFVMAQRGNSPIFPQIYGIDFSDKPVFDVEQFLLVGSLENLYDDTILISQSTAQRLGAGVGSVIELYSPLIIQKLKSEEVFLPSQYEVVGVYSVDWNQDFIPGIICTLRTMQDLYGLNDSAHGIAIRLEEGIDEFRIAKEVQSIVGDSYNVVTWKERWADFLWVLDLEKTMMLFINLFIVAVAVFAIANAQLLTVVRKTREIGLLNVIGAKRSQLLGIYVFQGFFIGLIGLILGSLIALFFLGFRDPIIHFLAEISGTRDTLIQYYYFANLPVDLSLNDFLVIGSAALSLSTLASLLPAWKAARIKPSQTLRIEQ